MLFSIDHGNSAMKTPHFTFTSGLADYPIRPPVETDVLEFGGKFWTLSGQRISYMRDKTKDDRFFVLSLFAIAKELQRMGGIPSVVEADLAVGLPPEHYELRRKFAGYFQRDCVRFTFNNKPVSLIVRQVLVYPQAYAAVVPRAALLKDTPRIFIIDSGGFTTDVMLLRDSKPDMQFCRSLEMGVIPMSNDIIGKVSALHDIRIEDDHISDVICGRPTILPEDVRETIFTAVKAYAFGILDKLRELQVDLRADPAVFVGGGAVLFKPFIEDSSLVTKADFILDQKANAIGYELLATHQLRKLFPQEAGGPLA